MAPSRPRVPRAPRAPRDRRAPTTALLACPYEKRYPLLFRRCRRLTLRRLKDVKQHLGSEHRLPLYCPVCDQDDFADEAARNNHVRARTCVEPLGGVQARHGLDATKLGQLARRASRNLGLHEQWMGLWAIAFPGVARPSSPLRGDSVEECIDMIVEDWNANGRRFVDVAVETLPADQPLDNLCQVAFLIAHEAVEQLLFSVRVSNATANFGDQDAADMMDIVDDNNTNSASSFAIGDGDPGTSSGPSGPSGPLH